MSRPNTCTAQPTTDRDDRGDTYRGRTRGPVCSDKRSGVSKRPRRHLSAREGTRGSDGNPRTYPGDRHNRGDTYRREDVPEVRTTPGRIGHPRRHLSAKDSASHYRRSAPVEFSIRACCQGTKKGSQVMQLRGARLPRYQTVAGWSIHYNQIKKANPPRIKSKAL